MRKQYCDDDEKTSKSAVAVVRVLVYARRLQVGCGRLEAGMNHDFWPVFMPLAGEWKDGVGCRLHRHCPY